jgi:hypothetical protein
MPFAFPTAAPLLRAAETLCAIRQAHSLPSIKPANRRHSHGPALGRKNTKRIVIKIYYLDTLSNNFLEIVNFFK